MISVIARREFTERLRSRLFLAVNVLVLAVVVAAILLPQLLDRGPQRQRIAVTDPASTQLVQSITPVEGDESRTRAVTVADRAAGEQELRDGEVDALVIEGATLVVPPGVTTGLERELLAAARARAIDGALRDAGVPAGQRGELLTAAPLTVERLDGDDPALAGATLLLLLLSIGVLYGLLIYHGQWVAQGIVEEKESRIVEVLLSAVRPRDLLAGKLLGVGLLGFLQVVLLAAVALTTMAAVDAVQIPSEARGAVVLMVGFYVLGFALYATLFAAAGAVAARGQDLQATTTPVVLVLVASLFTAQGLISQPDSTVSAVSGYIPFTAVMVQPIRYAAGVASAFEIVVAAVIAAATIALLVPLTGRLYRGGALRIHRRISLAEAWTSAE